MHPIVHRAGDAICLDLSRGRDSPLGRAALLATVQAFAQSTIDNMSNWLRASLNCALGVKPSL